MKYKEKRSPITDSWGIPQPKDDLEVSFWHFTFLVKERNFSLSCFSFSCHCECIYTQWLSRYLCSSLRTFAWNTYFVWAHVSLPSLHTFLWALHLCVGNSKDKSALTPVWCRLLKSVHDGKQTQSDYCRHDTGKSNYRRNPVVFYQGALDL